MMQTGIESIAAIIAQQSSLTDSAPLLQPALPPQGTSAFGKLIESQFAELNSNLGAAEGALNQLAAGKPVELHQVMIDLERAQLSVQTFVQIRNKVVEAYQDLMRMQL